jgi:hypothetical protein
VSNYNAIQLLKEHYSTPELEERIASNLKSINIKDDAERDTLEKRLNANAKRFLKKLSPRLRGK